VNLLTDLEDFVQDHRLYGTLTADATEPAWNGYLLTVTCSCGVVFERWVTPWDAGLDLLQSASLNCLSPAQTHPRTDRIWMTRECKSTRLDDSCSPGNQPIKH
jgi:hypothetical protein